MTNKLKLRSAAINTAYAEVKEAERKLARVVRTVQLRCKHPHVAETDYVPSNYGTALVPVRICLTCGMTEDGWGSGYRILKGTPSNTFDGVATKIDRNELYRLRQGLAIREEHKGPLIRREVSIVDLIKTVK